jgi:hypothetical protein
MSRARNGTGVTTGSYARIYTPHSANYKPGWAGGPGRPKGARNRVGAELAKEILQAAADTGFMIKDKDGNWEPTHNGGLLGYLRWATIHETKTYLGLIARVLPFNVVQEQPEEAILTHEQVLAQLEERGLPIDLVGVLREAPVQLDIGEDEDPFGMKKIEGGQS